MTLTELKYIVALAREKHFGKAAEACFGKYGKESLSTPASRSDQELGTCIHSIGAAAVPFIWA